MAITGIFLKGNAANFITLNGTRESHDPVDTGIERIELQKNPSQKDVAKVLSDLEAMVEKNGITQFIVNRRVTAGQMAGAAGTFIWEGILLSSSPIPLKFVHVATLRATDKKQGELKTHKPPEEKLGLCKAYDFAFEGLK